MLEKHSQVASINNFDRFIHPIAGSHLALPNYQINSNSYQTYLKNQLFETIKKPILKSRQPYQLPFALNMLVRTSQLKKQRQKSIPNLKPVKTHYVPFVFDCFHLNFLDFGYNNTIALAIKNKVFIWGSQADEAKLFNKRDLASCISSVKFDKDYYLAIGSTKSSICIYDMNKNQKAIKLLHQFNRINCLDWMGVNLASGSKNGYIAISDTRFGKSVIKYKSHQKDICTIKWNMQGNLLASAGFDEKVVIFDIRKGEELVTFSQHNGAIRAIDWCPQNSNIFLVGGGKNDRNLRFYSMQSLKQQYSIQTESQIYNVAFSKISNELVSSHGSKNDIKIWRSRSLWKDERGVENIGVMTGHERRVSYLAVNPDSDMIVTSSGDRTVRLWRPFHSGKQNRCELTSQQLR